MKGKEYNCYHCDAVFKIRTLSDEDLYPVYYCPYCGGDIEDLDDAEENEDEIEEDE